MRFTLFPALLACLVLGGAVRSDDDENPLKNERFKYEGSLLKVTPEKVVLRTAPTKTTFKEVEVPVNMETEYLTDRGRPLAFGIKNLILGRTVKIVAVVKEGKEVAAKVVIVVPRAADD